ncbi:hypothetical protein POM88_049700 [Heracleum sosnowskyi]|uniref:phosphogluconate dehydrogenase (NADP(+)-dependent, decarboxylating) n=1 Tax=Heracleum sosnowskyi TaxID=360622 RepID=A0AAD8GYC2_9APIA|nr:hypothetical protein POM88_049700 [Heracleum sosnowskyi]
MNLICANSIEMRWGLTLGELAKIWKGGCIIRAIFLERIKQAYDRNAYLSSLLVDPDDILVLNIAPISEKQEVVVGHDDEIVTIDKNYPAVDDFLVLTSIPRSVCLWIAKINLDKTDRTVEENTTPVLKKKLVLITENNQTQIENTASGDNTLVFGKKSRSQSSKRATKSKSDDEQSLKLEETTGILAGAADETTMSASKRRHDLTTKYIETQIDDTASGDNAPASGKKSRSQSQTTTSKREIISKNDNEQSSKLEETIDELPRMKLDELVRLQLFVTLNHVMYFLLMNRQECPRPNKRS